MLVDALCSIGFNYSYLLLVTFSSPSVKVVVTSYSVDICVYIRYDLVLTKVAYYYKSSWLMT